MSNPTISPGYGFVPCSHDDPKRSHYFECGRWEGIAGCVKPVCECCAKLPNRKPVEIPEGWELVPESEKFQRSFGWISTTYVSEGGGVHVPEIAIGVPVGEVADNGDYGCASIRAFIRRKPVQPTIEPSKPAVDWSKPLQQRSGERARLLGTLNGVPDKYVCAIESGEGECVESFFESGSMLTKVAMGHDSDIINTPERIERDVWLTLYRSGDISTDETEEAAKANRDKDRVACVRVQIDCNVGEGL
jgi:hypothetical protein